MKKKYGNKGSRSSRKSQRRARRKERQETERTIQLSLPLVELLASAQESLGRLVVDVGMSAVGCLLEDEVTQHAGERYGRQAERQAFRWGHDRGYVVLCGQKVPLQRPRVRSKDGQEIPLERYQLFQGGPQVLQEEVAKKILAQVSTRKYEEVIDTVSEGYGIKKSSVSRHWKAASAKQVKELMERSLGELNLVAIMIDGVHFHGHTVLAALGFTADGKKRVLGVWQGATENARVCQDLLNNLVERGLRTDQKTLFVLDGSKALSKAVLATFGKQAEIQRCQFHKEKNVLSYLPKSFHTVVRRRLRNAWALKSHKEAKKALKSAVDYLREISDSAATSLEEGLEETMTVHRLSVPETLRQTLRTTNPIENIFSRVKSHTRNVKNWRSEDMVERWAVAGLLRAERGFRRIKAYRDLPSFIASLRGKVDAAEVAA